MPEGWLPDGWSPTALLVHAAALTYVIGFLIRDQLMLRGLVLVGTGFYIAYYYVEPDRPLWDAIAWSVVLGLANAFTMWRILRDRQPPGFGEEDLAIYGAFGNMAPSAFRRIMAFAERGTADGPVTLTGEGRPVETLWLLLEGRAVLAKGSSERVLAAPAFIGEVGYLTRRPASATVVAQEGARWVRWDAERLRALAAKDEAVATSLEVAFNRDLAAKVAAS